MLQEARHEALQAGCHSPLADQCAVRLGHATSCIDIKIIEGTQPCN